MNFKILVMLASLSVRLSFLYKFKRTNLDINIRRQVNLKSTVANSQSVTPLQTRKNGDSLPVVVFVDPNIRKYLNMKNSERKTRILLPSNIREHNITVTSMKEMVEKRLNALQNQPYIIRYHIPGLTPSPRRYTLDEELKEAILWAHDNRINVQIYADIVPGQFPPPEKDYLLNMADPAETDTYTLVSFYRFADIHDPEQIKLELMELWKPFRSVGRIYVATEGINAQMAIPTNVLINFKKACETYWLLQGVRLNTDHLMTIDDYDTNRPFKALHIRVREQIVADGWKEPLNWEQSGREMPPLEWHEQLDNPNAIVLDCRNTYETDVGKFDNAIPLNTTFFRESWAVLDEILQDVPKNAPIMTYCTGGIRCVKINAYLEQKLGFQNVSRLEGGIISYARELENLNKNSASASSESTLQRAENEGGVIDESFEVDIVTVPSTIITSDTRRNVAVSKFRGMNYVFDERMITSITEEVFSKCETCGDSNDMFTNCKSNNCHIRFIQCMNCRSKYDNCCSRYCQHSFQDQTKAQMEKSTKSQQQQHQLLLTRKMKQQSQIISSKSTSNINTVQNKEKESMITSIETESLSVMTKQPPKDTTELNIEVDKQGWAMEEYCSRYTSDEPNWLYDLRQATEKHYNGSVGALRMLCSHTQGRLLVFLTKLKNSKAVLELGTFTGYSSLCFAEGISTVLQSTHPSSSSSNESVLPAVVTCDVDPEPQKLAKEFIQKSPFSHMIEVVNRGAAEVIDDMINQKRVFDIIFIDADKRQYQAYIEQILTGGVLRPGGLILIDNTLWKGLVLHKEADLQAYAQEYTMYGKEERMKKLTDTMHQFNVYLKNHSELQPVLLPLRDGLTLVEYIPTTSSNSDVMHKKT